MKTIWNQIEEELKEKKPTKYTPTIEIEIFYLNYITEILIKKNYHKLPLKEKQTLITQIIDQYITNQNWKRIISFYIQKEKYPYYPETKFIVTPTYSTNGHQPNYW
jgi:hypothetical protein